MGYIYNTCRVVKLHQVKFEVSCGCSCIGNWRSCVVLAPGLLPTTLRLLVNQQWWLQLFGLLALALLLLLFHLLSYLELIFGLRVIGKGFMNMCGRFIGLK